MDSVVAELLSQARASIKSGEKSLRDAAEYIAAAQDRGASQRKIAAEVGKSPAWVNRLLAWRSSGFIGDAFGAAHHRERTIGVHPGKRRRSQHAETLEDILRETDEQTDDELKAWWEAELAQARERVRARSERMRAGSEENRWSFGLNGGVGQQAINDAVRRKLVKALGMLGSDHDGEVLNAARVVEACRRRIGATWDQLIVVATERECDWAA